MKKYIPFLEHCGLFEEIEEDNLISMLGCLGAKIITVKKNEVIFQEGSSAKSIGIILSGAVQMVQDDFYGNRTIVTQIEEYGLFGESFACAGIDHLPVSFVASKDCEIMLIDCRRITNTCCNACAFHKQIIFNLLQLVARKNLDFHQKIEITSKRTTREKLMAYLLSVAKQADSHSFSIPYDRQGLADYLGVERSAMSAEISKLRKEGIIECQKNLFTIL
jgi:CRP-like cAMP-binding protein